MGTGERGGRVLYSGPPAGLRKVPDNVPQQEMLRAHLGRPLWIITESDLNDPRLVGIVSEYAAELGN